MAHRLSKITTRTGDRGDTGLGDGSRVSKSSARVHALGELDELNSAIGLVLAEDVPAEVSEALNDVQHDLFDLGGEVSIPGHALLTEAQVGRLEATIERWNAELPALKEFILPGGTRAAASAHLARTICRRTERAVVALGHRVHRCLAELSRLQASLAGMDPTAVLERGYSITRTADGKVLRDAARISEGDEIFSTLARGSLVSKVKKREIL